MGAAKGLHGWMVARPDGQRSEPMMQFSHMLELHIVSTDKRAIPKDVTIG